MKVPIFTPKAHRGLTLEFDQPRETVRLLGSDGEFLGSVTWSNVIDFIQTSVEDRTRSDTRTDLRIPLTVSVEYQTTDGKRFKSVTGAMSGGGLFIETKHPLPIGTELSLRFSLPAPIQESITTKGRVSWIRNKTHRNLLMPGMDLEFTTIDPNARKRIIELIQDARPPRP